MASTAPLVPAAVNDAATGVEAGSQTPMRGLDVIEVLAADVRAVAAGIGRDLGWTG